MPLISSGIGAAAGLAQTITGAINNKKAKREAEELARSRPVHTTSPEIGKNLSLAESEAASGGVSARAENAYNNLNNKQFSASLGAILRGGGSVNNVADVFGENESGRQKLALLSDDLRLKQIDRLTAARNQTAEETDKNFEFNQWMPWADKSQANAASRQQAQNNIWSGIGTIANQAQQYAGIKANDNAYANYFKMMNGGGSGTNNSTFTPPPLVNPNLPTTGRSNMSAAPQFQPRNSGNNGVYSYNWTPENEQNQYQNDFGTIYQ